ncbi:AUGMIN subunit 8-like [Olea europaea var. sylvestris]|uniref:AUGMIN subunit 8-like n=1 Tax=Olea europaea var. sylvestris TaxID=158386 RepID=UPI000C1D55DC|nr:AUGMIN subunit 8-like [Olea europaea var. sylvestris]XP_022852235.1 AUGMIN subunit 8-like [Olea europaea var. sylvestris]XP_022852236.1 AUGMIN subunit 8-like [Olea europaea var. sylvestris]XP_022852237.1 AUGMIN subunit 8-like [Olea europaea var. sylvestris]
MCAVWMDACESEQALQKRSTEETTRPPLVPADNKNETTRRSRTRDVSSRYRSPTPSTAASPKCCPSPTVKVSSNSTVLAPKRAISAERKFPSRPSSPPSLSPSTPVGDTTAEMLFASRKIVGNRLPESLWPSTVCNRCVSLQSDTLTRPVNKMEKPVSHALSDRNMKSSLNITYRKGETPPASGKPTPERKRSPLKGKNSVNQSENSRPVDSLPSRLLDQHRWPSRIPGKVSSNILNRSIDITKKNSKTPTSSHLGMGTRTLRRLSFDGASRPLQKSSSDLLTLVSSDRNDSSSSNCFSADDGSLLIQKPGSSSIFDGTPLVKPAVRSQSLPRGSRPASPSVTREISLSRTKTVNSSSSIGNSPAQVRPSSPSRQPQASTSVLSFIVDIKRGRKAANHIEDVHQLRLLYNRQLQWQYANARADAALRVQKVKAEKTLYRVWRTIVDLRDWVIGKRIDIQQLRFKLRLCKVLNNQVVCLDKWASIETEHTNSLSWAIQDVQAGVLCIPITGGARGDIEVVKAAVCSALDVMQAMGSSLCSILSQVEGMNGLVSQLADVSEKERAMLDECETLMASIVATQAEEYSLRTHLLQLKQAWEDSKPLTFE